jgi:hypothetical protein
LQFTAKRAFSANAGAGRTASWLFDETDHTLSELLFVRLLRPAASAKGTWAMSNADLG